MEFLLQLFFGHFFGNFFITIPHFLVEVRDKEGL